MPSRGQRRGFLGHLTSTRGPPLRIQGGIARGGNVDQIESHTDDQDNRANEGRDGNCLVAYQPLACDQRERCLLGADGVTREVAFDVS